MHPSSLEAIQRILGRRISSVLIATRYNRDCTGREFFTRLYLGFEDGHLYEFWIHATDELHGAKGLDRETGLDRVQIETSDPGSSLRAFFLDPEEQTQADQLIASAAFYGLLQETPVRPEALHRLAEAYRKHGVDPRPLYQWALDRLRPDQRRGAPGLEDLP